MKVGILTLPLWHNYGGILQAYALRLTIEKLGHNAIFLDVKRDSISPTELSIKNAKRWVNSTILSSKNKPYYPNQKELNDISLNTRRFVEENIKPSSKHLPLSCLSSFSANFDAIVVGSDQVWRPEYCPNLEVFFLGFCSNNIRKISYAASLGADNWRFTAEETEYCKRLLNDFHSISVREDSAVNLFRENMEVEVIQLCDPALLLDAKDYLSILGEQSTPLSGGHGIFCYALDSQEERMQGLSKLSSNLNYDVFYIMPKVFDKYYQKSPNDYIFPPVENWIEAFQKSDLVITDSFHGCIFSIIFNKPFIAISNNERGRTRFESLLSLFNLENRLFNSVREIEISVLNAPLDWDKINEVRENQKNSGLFFLHKSLS